MDTRERIFELLDEKKIGQKALASALEVSEDIISDWRRGKSKSYRKYVSQIAQALGTTSEYLLEGKESSPPPEGDELFEKFRELTPEEREAALAYIAFLKARRQKP